MVRRIEMNAPKGHCCGADLPAWRVDVKDGDYDVPTGTLITLSKIGHRPNDKYMLKFKAPKGGNPCPQLKSMVLIPVVRKPPSEIAFADLINMVAGWQGNYLKASYDILGSKHNYLIGLGRVEQVPTLALFIKSKYSGRPGDCRTFAFVLKKLDEVGGRKQRILQGGVIHGGEN